MPPRTRFSRARILDAAIDLTREQGIAAISARAVASQLGCSTAPVFTRFASMEALHEALLDRVIAAFVEAIEEAAGSITDLDPLLAVGLGWVRFAADEPRLYETLFLTHHRYHFKWGPIRRMLAARMAEHPRYAALSDAERFALVGRVSVVVHGLGVEVWSGRLPDPSPARLSSLLTQLAGPLIDASIAQGWTTDIHSALS